MFPLSVDCCVLQIQAIWAGLTLPGVDDSLQLLADVTGRVSYMFAGTFAGTSPFHLFLEHGGNSENILGLPLSLEISSSGPTGFRALMSARLHFPQLGILPLRVLSHFTCHFEHTDGRHPNEDTKYFAHQGHNGECISDFDVFSLVSRASVVLASDPRSVHLESQAA